MQLFNGCIYNMNEQSRVLVVGATGHVGSQVVKILARDGHRVRALVRTDGQTIDGADRLDIEYSIGDLTDRASIDRSLEGVRAVVSTANSIIPTGSTPAAAELNRTTGDVLVDAAVRHGVERFVQSSVPVHEWGDRHVPELAGKRQLEAALQASPLGYTIVRNPAFTDVWLVMAGAAQAANRDPHATTARPFGFMQTWQRLTGDLVSERGRLLAPGGPDHGAAFITTRDAAHAMAASVSSPRTLRRTIELGGPEWLTWRDVADLFSQRLGRPVRPVTMPRWFANTGRLAAKPFSPSVSNVLALTTFVATYQPRWEDAPVVAELGLPPQQSVADYLDEHLAIGERTPA